MLCLKTSEEAFAESVEMGCQTPEERSERL